MTAVMSRSESSSPMASPAVNPNHPALPPLITSPPARRSTLQRPISHASKHRLSQYSNTSTFSKSRPPSAVYPLFHSSLPYTNVRDFGYPSNSLMHYGPPPEPSNPPSGISTPASEHKRFSDPPTAWDSTGAWRPGHWGGGVLVNGAELPPAHFGDGPPWSEDEDLQSPVVVSSRRKHSKGRGRGNSRGRGRNRTTEEQGEREDRGIYMGASGDGSERYYVNDGDEANGPGGEIVTYPPERARHSMLAPHGATNRRDSHFAGTLPNRSYIDAGPDNTSESDASSVDSSPGMTRDDESRYSKDYQFTIASPDEEMHGKAVALFDFERENENELPLVEGQVIWVSYRHGQGWLVAEDPKTQESGLVPEEYVRLLRDIQGGLNSLTGPIHDQLLSPVGDGGTPTQAEHNETFGHSSHPSNGSNGYQQPVVSTFSTSSKDLHPYPQHLLGTQAGQAPPQVLHYHGQRGGSQVNTPTLASSPQGSKERAESTDSLLGKTSESAGATPVALKTSTQDLGEPMDIDSAEKDSGESKEEDR